MIGKGDMEEEREMEKGFVERRGGETFDCHGEGEKQEPWRREIGEEGEGRRMNNSERKRVRDKNFESLKKII